VSVSNADAMEHEVVLFVVSMMAKRGETHIAFHGISIGSASANNQRHCKDAQ